MRLRISIRLLMTVVVLVAVLIAAWRGATEPWANVVFNLTVLALLIASFEARYSAVDRRSLRKDRAMARTSGLSAFYLGLCLSRLALADGPAAIPAGGPQRAVERAIGYLQAESAAWLNTRKCAA